MDLYAYRLISMTDAAAVGEVIAGETGVTEVTVTGLTPCAQYAFSVAGKTSAGAVYSDELDITTEAEGRFRIHWMLKLHTLKRTQMSWLFSSWDDV